MNKKKRILIFASGSATFNGSSGSGCERIVQDIDLGIIQNADATLASHHLQGSIQRIASQYDKWFAPVVKPYGAKAYQWLVNFHKPDLIVLVGWLKLVCGIDFNAYPTVNMHPARLPEFGGPGMYDLNVHLKVLMSGAEDTAPTIHWVNNEYDAGKKIFECPPVAIETGDTPYSLQQRVKPVEHEYYGGVINQILNG